MKALSIRLARIVYSLLLGCSLMCHSLGTTFGQTYDPIAVSAKSKNSPVELTITDQTRNREIPVRVFMPMNQDASPVVLFSHGLGGSRRAGSYCAEHWSSRGYVVVVMQHAGSDEFVWKGVALRKRREALRNAASYSNTIARFEDVVAVIDQLAKWNESHDRFQGRFDLAKIGMSGHSYGAATTQGVSGQSAPTIGQRYTDRRIVAALMFSPNRPKRGAPAQAFGKVSIPWMLMTGTEDTSPIGDTTVKDRRQVYPALPDTIDRYELVLSGAEHNAFGDGNTRTRKRNPNHHQVILALSTAFWDAHLMGNAEARKWLHSDSPRKIMEAEDLWQFEAKVTDVAKNEAK